MQCKLAEAATSAAEAEKVRQPKMAQAFEEELVREVHEGAGTVQRGSGRPGWDWMPPRRRDVWRT